nr:MULTISPECIES: FAD-dependent oxidoreductase [Pelistega]
MIGFGKAGKTLAAKMATQGKKVALIEQSPQMYGDTCINIGCIPSKTLITAADKGKLFDASMADKTAITTRLRKKNYDTMVGANVEVITGSAKFIANKEIEVKTEQGTSQLTAETIIINTGAGSVVLPIKGLAESKNVFDSTGIQFLPTLPKNLESLVAEISA